MAYAIRAYATNRPPDPAWIGPIPSHWEVKKLKYTIVALESGVSVNATDLPAGNEELGVLKTSCVYTGGFRASENKTVVPEELGRVKCPVREQAIIISRMNTPDLVGASGLVTRPHDNLFLPDRLWQTVFRSEADVAARYVAYFLGTEGFRKQVSLAAEGASSSMQNVAKPDFLAIPTTIPPLKEQKQIALFLDHETAKMDALIEKQQQLIALLQEKRQAVISHAVTKGLNPDAPLRDSGVEWLGEVPAHWKVHCLRFSAADGYKKFTDGDWVESPFITDKGVRLIQTGNVGIGEFREKGFRYVSEDSFRRLNCTEIVPGDVLVCRLDGPVGRACLVPDLGVKMITSVDNAILKPSSDFDSRFLVYMMTSSQWIGWIENICRAGGGFRFRISRTMLGNQMIPVPPVQEQQAIANELDDGRFQYEQLIRKSKEAVTLLQERRTALISAAVTGKIDVRGWKAPDSETEAEVA